MRRGDVVTVAAGGGFGGKPRPGLVIQADQFSDTGTVVLALFTSELAETPLTRLRFDPSPENGLKLPSELMADIIISTGRDCVGKVIGRLSSDEMSRVDRALLVFLGLAG